jgi:hypothetical protein
MLMIPVEHEILVIRCILSNIPMKSVENHILANCSTGYTGKKAEYRSSIQI